MILPSPSASRSSSNPGDLPMNRVAVPNAVQLVEASSEGREVSAGQHEQHENCIQQFALSAVLILWFPSGRVATGRYTVAIASTQWDVRRSCHYGGFSICSISTGTVNQSLNSIKRYLRLERNKGSKYTIPEPPPRPEPEPRPTPRPTSPTPPLPERKLG